MWVSVEEAGGRIEVTGAWTGTALHEQLRRPERHRSAPGGAPCLPSLSADLPPPHQETGVTAFEASVLDIKCSLVATLPRYSGT